MVSKIACGRVSALQCERVACAAGSRATITTDAGSIIQQQPGLEQQQQRSMAAAATAKTQNMTGAPTASSEVESTKSPNNTNQQPPPEQPADHQDEQKEDELNANANNNKTPGSVKKKRRKRRWKPYHKLTLEEKRELELRQQERAEKTRADRFAHGQPMAPYNTTQFLLEDYEARQAEELASDELDLHHNKSGRSRTRSESYAGSEISEGSASAPGGVGHSYDSSDSFEREFELEYEREQAHRLEGLTRDDLIRENAQLCDELAREKDQVLKMRDTIAKMKHENEQLALQLATADKTPTHNTSSNSQQGTQFTMGGSPG